MYWLLKRGGGSLHEFWTLESRAYNQDTQAVL